MRCGDDQDAGLSLEIITVREMLGRLWKTGKVSSVARKDFRLQQDRFHGSFLKVWRGLILTQESLDHHPERHRRFRATPAPKADLCP